ncbi:hypothetical protein BKA63DRAFT_572931 [Paraphoma chrysanthemicola]|nr:hypothetical protein BKA63DRAFT_572931 [Paraphoma chrysanthemicola]
MSIGSSTQLSEQASTLPSHRSPKVVIIEPSKTLNTSAPISTLPSTSSAPAPWILLIPPDFTSKTLTAPTPKTTATLALPSSTDITLVTATAPVPAPAAPPFPTPGNTTRIIPEMMEPIGPIIGFWIVIALIVVPYLIWLAWELYKEIEEIIWSQRQGRGQREHRLLSEVEWWELDPQEVEHRGPSEDSRTWPA